MPLKLQFSHQKNQFFQINLKNYQNYTGTPHLFNNQNKTHLFPSTESLVQAKRSTPQMLKKIAYKQNYQFLIFYHYFYLHPADKKLPFYFKFSTAH